MDTTVNKLKKKGWIVGLKASHGAVVEDFEDLGLESDDCS